TVKSIEFKFSKSQLSNGSFDQSLLKTTGVLNLLADLKPLSSKILIEKASSYLLSVLEAQPGYDRAKSVKPSSLEMPCDLCGFFGSYEDRNRPEVLALGAREMNFYREFEPLLGPKSAVRAVRRSSLDRPGPSSCYSWGLIPLCYTIEALCRAGYAEDPKLKPAINVLSGAQRESGGWCRNLAGHPNCTIHAIRALASHPQLKHGTHAEKALRFMHMTQHASADRRKRWWGGSNVFAAIQAVAAWDIPVAQDIIHSSVAGLAHRQQKNGTWGRSCRTERVAAVLYTARRIA
ncbi:MAG: hypothetical protein NWF14_07740, partial [Candidatus Bathyarchaeota archaeon]|nr:hypothetical protein [Candidatus Bathyarchaeota archaeon]